MLPTAASFAKTLEISYSMQQIDLITIVHYFDLTDIFRTQRVLCDLKHSLNNINNAALFVQKVRKSNQIIALNLKNKTKLMYMYLTTA